MGEPQIGGGGPDFEIAVGGGGGKGGEGTEFLTQILWGAILENMCS